MGMFLNSDFQNEYIHTTNRVQAYLLAAAEMGLRHDIREDMSSFTGCGVLQLDEPMIHFSDWTKGVRNGQVFKWSKGMHDALNLIPGNTKANQRRGTFVLYI